MRILFAADGSQQTKKALAYLATHEDMLGGDGELVVLNVQAVVPTRVGSMLGAAAVKEYYGEHADACSIPSKNFSINTACVIAVCT